MRVSIKNIGEQELLLSKLEEKFQEPEFETRYFLDSWRQNSVHNTLQYCEGNSWGILEKFGGQLFFVQDSAHIVK